MSCTLYVSRLPSNTSESIEVNIKYFIIYFGLFVLKYEIYIVLLQRKQFILKDIFSQFGTVLNVKLVGKFSIQFI